MKIDSRDVKEFKDLCDENYIIPKILKEKLSQYFQEPILDIGSGIGDIMTRAFPKKRVIHIDIEDFTHFEVSPNHLRKTISFFDYKPTEKIGTILMSHVLQYIDDDIDKLNKKLAEINSDNLIIISNIINDSMSRLLSWFKENIKEANPEVHLEGFPEGYELIKSESFTATVKLSTFKDLAIQIATMLFDVVLEGAQLNSLIEFLKQENSEPTFTIDQEVKVYNKK